MLLGALTGSTCFSLSSWSTMVCCMVLESVPHCLDSDLSEVVALDLDLNFILNNLICIALFDLTSLAFLVVHTSVSVEQCS